MPGTVRGVHSSPSSRGASHYSINIIDINAEPVYAASASPRFQKQQPLQTRHSRDMLKLQKSCTTMPSYLMQCLPRNLSRQFSVLKDELTLYVAPSAVIPVLTIPSRPFSSASSSLWWTSAGCRFPREMRQEVRGGLSPAKHQVCCEDTGQNVRR